MKSFVLSSFIILIFPFLGGIACSNDTQKNMRSSDIQSSGFLKDVVGYTWYICLPDGSDYYYNGFVIQEATAGQYKFTFTTHGADDSACLNKNDRPDIESDIVTIEKSGESLKACSVLNGNCGLITLTSNGELLMPNGEVRKRR